MTDERPAGRSRWGTPTTLVLYRTPDRWRHAVYLSDPDGVLDGSLPDIAPTCAVEQAQSDLHRRVELANGRRFHLSWHEADKPDWWTAEVTDLGPLPQPE
ncbi:hypothetical protein OHB26_29855 [Nocardia sp. NBC_01503]|uniref:hypothetical protein n=1 Tax=Nocardia sp. NBC_01503 TaxID=2975997 RepID=UPI002E7BD1DA|nr:hypothetical protein [Nocardia sp. NBC_01503]WTL31091.1 hypothetical protein OHB26_29855 [Nocardia sp. NBC_01503]